MLRFISGPLLGRLGNQMFIYAFARNLGLELRLPVLLTEGINKCSFNNDNRLDCFRLSADVQFAKDVPLSKLQRLGVKLYGWSSHYVAGGEIMKLTKLESWLRPILNKLGVHYSQEGCLVPSNRMRECAFMGYFQSEKCFLQHKKEILQDFTFDEGKITRVQALGTQIAANEHSCAMHVRRGDYINHSIYGICGDDYYVRCINAMRQIDERTYFYVFSDDIEAVRCSLGDTLGDATYIPSFYNEQESLYLASCCRHFIMSNSSYSWWMQYLAQSDGAILAPAKWAKHPRPCQMYQKHWKLIDV